MEWSRVKSIMIGVFFLVNVFLFINYMSTMKTGITISSKAIKDTALVLSQNNVVIAEEIIPKKTQDLRIFDVVNKYETPQAAAFKIWETAQKAGLDYFNPDKTTFDDSSFEYNTIVSPSEIITGERSALSYAKKTVSQLGLDNSLNLESKIQKTSSGYSVTFNQVYEGNLVLDACLTIELSGGGITRIHCKNWLGDYVTGGGMAAVTAPTEILINFAIGSEHIEKVTITDVKLGYFIGSRYGSKSTVTVVPVWMLSTDTAGTLYFDARNGDLLK